MTYRSTKTYEHSAGLSACFRQWRAKSHCRFLHGYALSFRFEFEAEQLDENGWVIDFGSLKALKALLEETFDHQTLVAQDDPHLNWYQEGARLGILQFRMVRAMGVEAFAHMAWEMADDLIYEQGHGDRVRVASVECREHPGNSAIYIP